MGSLLERKLGSRPLKLGDHGSDVLKLQKYLKEHGYDFGNEEAYGYLTKDAVCQFQREHGLLVDGIAGKRFFALMLNKELPFRRHVHVVQSKESLAQITELYGVGHEAFGISSHKKHIYPGQRLHFFYREIWGISTDENISAEEVELTGIIHSEGYANKQDIPQIMLPSEMEKFNLPKIHQLLKSRKEKKQIIEMLVGSARKAHGLYLPWKEVPALDGARYLRFLKSLRKSLPDSQQLWVELGPGVPPWKIWGGIDYEGINKVADRIVFSLPAPRKPGAFINGNELDELLCTLLRQVHSWKVLLKVPVYALEWRDTEEGATYDKFAYSTALSRVYRHGARLKKDEDGNVFYHYKNRSGSFYLTLPHYDLMQKICYVINRLNLAGLVIDRLGFEDPRIWQVIKSNFKAI